MMTGPLPRIRTAGVVRFHAEHEVAGLVLDHLAAMTDAVYVWANRVEHERIARAVREHPKVAGYMVSDTDYHSGRSLSEMAGMLAGSRPDWCILIDGDELLPAEMPELMRQADADGHDVLKFRYLIPVGSPEMVIQRVTADPFSPHCKAFKYRRDMIFDDREHWRGGHLPYGQWKPKLSPWPARHLCFLKESMRRRRRLKLPQSYAWFDAGWPWDLTPFVPGLTWDRWVEREQKAKP